MECTLKRNNCKDIKLLSELLNSCIGQMAPEEKRASIAFIIANLIIENLDKVEGLGILEIIKLLLTSENGNNASQLQVFYIS